MRPNAFISLPISNSEVKQKLTELQQKIIANDSSVKSLSVSPATFHLTLMVVNVQHRDLSRAHAALLESAQFISPMLAAIDYKLNLNKLSSFGENVVFVTMSDEQEIAAFKAAAAKIQEIFAAHGIPSTDEREAMPHITLFKSVGRNRRRIPYQTFQGLHDTECGDESLTKLELCSMSQPKQDSGYYHVFYEGNLQS